MFEEFAQRQVQPQSTVTLDFSSNVVLTTERLAEKLKDINTITDEELFRLVKDYYEIILSDIFIKKEQRKQSAFVSLFLEPRFITSLTQVMYSLPPTNHLVRRRLNKMSYDYLVINEKNQDPYIKDLMMALSKTVNRDKIPRLCGLALSEDFASLLTLVRYSSEKEIINVKRLNRVLMDQPVESLSEQRIVDIYLSLFDHVLPLFTGVMLDVVSPQNLSNSALEIYGLITLSILDIMNELPIADIKRGLKMFDDDRKIQYPDNSLRFNLESCSPNDYPRILRAIDELKQEGIYISTK